MVRPSPLPGFVHAAVDQEIGRCSGQRRAHSPTGTTTFSVVQPKALSRRRNHHRVSLHLV